MARTLTVIQPESTVDPNAVQVDIKTTTTTTETVPHTIASLKKGLERKDQEISNAIARVKTLKIAANADIDLINEIAAKIKIDTGIEAKDLPVKYTI